MLVHTFSILFALSVTYLVHALPAAGLQDLAALAPPASHEHLGAALNLPDVRPLTFTDPTPFS